MVPVAAAVPMVVPAGVRQRDGEALVGLDRGVAGDVDGDGLAGLAGGEADACPGQHAAGEVGRVRRAAAAAGHRPGHAARPRRVARAGDGEGERRAAGITLRLAGVAAAIESCEASASSLRMVPVAAAVPMVVPAEGSTA